MEAVERGRRQAHQCELLVLEHLSDGAIAKLGMSMGVGVFQATIEQPRVQLVVAGKAQPGRKKAFAIQTAIENQKITSHDVFEKRQFPGALRR